MELFLEDVSKARMTLVNLRFLLVTNALNIVASAACSTALWDDVRLRVLRGGRGRIGVRFTRAEKFPHLYAEGRQAGSGKHKKDLKTYCRPKIILLQKFFGGYLSVQQCTKITLDTKYSLLEWREKK